MEHASGGRARAYAPGRVNLIGDHTDYTGGFVLPMAIDLGTTVDLMRDRATRAVELTSTSTRKGSGVARYVRAVAAVIRPAVGGTGTVSTTLPVGAGLSSSSALVVAIALALGFEGSPLELALACQHAEQLASGTPCGIMDQLASAAGVAGHGLLIDCTSNTVIPVAIPDDVDVVVAHSGQSRAVSDSPYAERKAQCEAAAATLGPLRQATLADVTTLDDPILRRRGRHVVTENQRVLAFAGCLRAGDLAGAGKLMTESHRSLRDDFEVSTPALDALVAEMAATPGVYGARLTGAGFGGCVVALAEPGSRVKGWRVTASAGASRIDG
jgi:galactokinase